MSENTNTQRCLKGIFLCLVSPLLSSTTVNSQNKRFPRTQRIGRINTKVISFARVSWFRSLDCFRGQQRAELKSHRSPKLARDGGHLQRTIKALRFARVAYCQMIRSELQCCTSFTEKKKHYRTERWNMCKNSERWLIKWPLKY